MTMTYRHLADEGSFLSHVHELFDIGKQTTTPEKAAMFMAFPFFEKLPFWCFGGSFAIMGYCRASSQQLFDKPFHKVKAQIADGTALRSLVADFLSQAHDDTGEYMMKAVVLTGYMAGMETTASILQTFLLAMVLYPDVQARAHVEIDQAVRHDSILCLDDRASLPYLAAILCDS
ncbi:hypothetical protein BDR06DRAFT_1007656 [Suillus hirtellus]|nr:hypothetical protein BDR06DRAFT_1007656 [Suillus hirtellus]